MDIQITKGILTPRQDVVLHVDLERRPSGAYSFISNLYETSQEGYTTGENPVFHSSGNGIPELQDALTFLDLLLQINDLPECDLEMATWLFECETREPGRYKVRYQVRDQVAHIKDHGESEFRLLPAHRAEHASVV